MIMGKIVDYVYKQPLRSLYMQGPHISNYGFWQGKTNEEICSLLTNTHTDIWMGSNQLRCMQMIDSSFDSFSICISTVIYGVLMYKSISHSLHRLFSTPNKAIQFIKKDDKLYLLN